MKLPKYKRIIYEHNPLNEVICQLRFPPILKITNQDPVEFQEQIRGKYPLFETRIPELPSNVSELSNILKLDLKDQKSYIFKSPDSSWRVHLGRESLSIVTSNYIRYEDFKDRLREILDIFSEVYKPFNYQRVGLRYQDIITRSELQLEEKDWSELISKEIAAEFHDEHFADSLDFFFKQLQFSLERGNVTFRHGIVDVEKSDGGGSERGYILDADFYTQTEIGQNHEIFGCLDEFNQYARNLFRFSITETLHLALSPRNLE